MNSSIKYEDLKTLFESNPQNAIDQCQNIILQTSHFKSPKEFAKYFREHGEIYCCQEESSSYCIGISCCDCSLNSGSFLCLDCFFNGNHQNHKYIVHADTYGSCDCGNPVQLKHQGFCNRHKGIPEDDQITNNLGDELTELLTNVVFKAAFSSLTKYKRSNSKDLYIIFAYLGSFLQFGDIFRRLLSISLTEKTDFKQLMSHIASYSSNFNSELQTFCGKLVNDKIFIQNFSQVAFDLILSDILQKQILITANNALYGNIECWNFFWFHSFSKNSFQINILQKKWDWVTYVIQFSKQLKKHFTLEVKQIHDFFPFYCDIVPCFFIASEIQPNEETQSLFDRLFNDVLNCDMKNETVTLVSYLDQGNVYLKSILLFNTSFYNFFNCFKYKKNLKFDSFFCQLEKLIAISPLYDFRSGDKFAMRFLSVENDEISYPSYYYQSFHNGASFFFSNPIYDSLVHLFGLENICKIKIGQFLSLEKCQSLRFKLLIITLKKLLSFVANQADLIPKGNFELLDVIDIVSSSTKRIWEGLPLFLPLFQLLLGMKQMKGEDEFSLKEFTAFETARLLGIFDDFSGKEYKDEDTNEKLDEMIFSFLYFVILTVVERTLFNYNNMEFLKEQLVYAIMIGHTKMGKLQSFCSENVLDVTRYPLNFSECLIEIATIQRSNSDRDNLLYKPEDTLDIQLKEGVKWKPFTAVVPFYYSKGLMNKIISKNPEKLIEVQDFEPEETYFFNAPLFSVISLSTVSLDYQPQINEETDIENNVKIQLKEFLFTPTVLAITYHSLRKSCNSMHLNDHLSLNILILISKFLKEKNIETQIKFDGNKTITYKSILDLITQMKTVLFNENSDATIENSMNIENFKELLKIKFVYNDLPPKSFIDLLYEKGQLGSKAFSILKENLGFDDIDKVEANKTEDDDEKKNEKKMKASQVKSNILNSFNKMISNFSINDKNANSQSDEEEEEVKSTDLCSICGSEKENESTSYPIYIFPTKFPFIVDKPPEAREGEDLGDSVEVACDDDCLNSEEEENNRNRNLIQNDENNRNEEEEEINQNNRNRNLIQNDENNRNEEEEEINQNSRNRNLIQNDENNRNEEEEINQNNRNRNLIQNDENNRNENENLADDFINNEEEEEEESLYDIERARMIFNRLVEEKRRLAQLNNNVNDNHVKRYTAGANCVMQFSMCQHPLHRSCVSSKSFKCPMDRTEKNAFLPCLDGSTTQTNLNENDTKSIELFLNDFSSFISKSSQKVDVFIELIKSISGLIVTNEVRLRSLPGCLDAKKNKILARNLFLATWHAYRIRKKPRMLNKRPYSKTESGNNSSDIDCDDVELRLTEFQRFVKKLIECDEIEIDHLTSFKRIVSSFVLSSFSGETKEKELCLFLRRVCLSEYFLLKSVDDKENDFIDWDEVLSVKNLSKSYDIEFKSLNENQEFEFKPFLCKKLPDEFLRLSQKPYKLPMKGTGKYKMYNIFDFNDLIINYDDLSDGYKEIDERKEKQEIAEFGNFDFFLEMSANYGRKNYPSVLVQIGKSASDVFIFNQNAISFMESFYVDKNGLIDIGFFRYQPIFLNHEKYEKFIDSILSGEFVDYSVSVMNLI